MCKKQLPFKGCSTSDSDFKYFIYFPLGGDKVSMLTHTYSGAYTEIVIRGGPGVEVEVNVVSSEGVSHYRPRGSGGMVPQENFLKYLSQMVHYKSILKVIWEQKLDYCCSKILHSSNLGGPGPAGPPPLNGEG